MTYHKANAMATQLGKEFPEVTFNIRESTSGKGHEVHATTKALQLSGAELMAMGDIISPQKISFGRSGANFRMIIN